MICLCLSGTTLESWGEQLERNRRWISLVELRVDLLKPAERVPATIRRWWESVDTGLPLILTIRRPRDLGRWEGDEAQRAYLFEELLDELHPTYVDLELDRLGEPAWDRIAQRVHAAGGTIIRSHHEPRETPQELSPLVARLAGRSREIPKLAVQTNSTADLLALLRAAEEFKHRMPGRRALWVGMGDHGALTRVCPSRFRSAWTYASDGEQEAPAPGQIDPQTLKELYRVEEARPEWPLFAVIGNPVGHSRSPEYHNNRFIDRRRPAVYVPLLVDDFSLFPELADLLGLYGASVTVPHKEAARRLAGDNAEDGGTGALNTLLRVKSDDGSLRWRGINTDIEGFLDALRGASTLPAGAKAAVIGAGGAARAIVAGLFRESLVVHLFNRTVERAGDLARELGVPQDNVHGLPEIAQPEGERFDVIVQTTSVGMDGTTDPIPFYRFHGGETVLDIIYTPRETPLLARARAAGCGTLNGETMFRRQAELQFDAFCRLIDDGEECR